MIFNNKFILASASSSRFKILKNNNLNFVKKEPICNEEKTKLKLISQKASPEKISLELARIKANSISVKKTNTLVVGSDTVICFQGSLLSKAINVKDAKKKITQLCGNTHTIFSSASVYLGSKEVWNTTQKSTIKIRDLSEEEINCYLKKTGKKILFSVGCYQIESLGPNIIESIKGDFFNVMGFPLFPFLNFLKEYKVK